MAEQNRSRIISDNDLHVITTSFINAAEQIHIAMCRFDDDHAAQRFLNSAMNSVLIGAQQCNQLHGSAKYRIADEPTEEEHDY